VRARRLAAVLLAYFVKSKGAPTKGVALVRRLLTPLRGFPLRSFGLDVAVDLVSFV
jgi:hypothetical protein